MNYTKNEAKEIIEWSLNRVREKLAELRDKPVLTQHERRMKRLYLRLEATDVELLSKVEDIL